MGLDERKVGAMASSYGTDAGKTALRQEYLTVREAWPQASKEGVDSRVRARLWGHPFFQDAKLVLSYVSVASEVDTRAIIEGAWAAGKRVAVPRCMPDGGLKFFEICSFDELAIGTKGIPEPTAPVEEALDYPDMVGSVCLVPGLVFDADGYSIGYGGGYYDSFLPMYPGDKIGLARAMQLSSNPLPHDEHDVPVDVLVTDAAVWSCR